MNNNMFDPTIINNLNKVIKNFQIKSEQTPFEFKYIKKYLLIGLLSIFISGFGVGLFIGLMF